MSALTQASALTAWWLGRRVAVTTRGAVATGYLSDTDTLPTGDVRLYLGGHCVDVAPTDEVTTTGLGILESEAPR
jgi:hypothetical protein